MRGWLSSHSQLIIHGSLCVALLGTNVALIWRLTTLSMQSTPVLAVSLPTIEASAKQPALADRVQREHIFGTPQAYAGVTVGTPLIRVSVAGIAYSSNQEDSFALITVSGETLVCHVGTSLSNGQTVTGIQADRIHLTGPMGETFAMLDIQQADINQAVSWNLLATASEASVEGQLPIGISDGESAPMPASPAALVPTHYVSREFLRGRGASERFKSLNKPVVYRSKPRP